MKIKTPYEDQAADQSEEEEENVFEDEHRGIVCYLDDQGEITCEGYDEGPRLHHGVSRFSCHQRGKQDMTHLLERSLLQVTDSGKVN
ncbi:hypothetical protein L1987_70490 [Smallanthus sonchifolius]|uniref:Uncharacterized protein n=1 Tax=Smallanthus sonchifolius TaxID=185202 RepID=A0ACB9AR22_9ASTR|nr:hypothetical protein L1987_70490 [Smallanthus sonchifolius]